MANFALLGVCLIVGVLLRVGKRLPADAPSTLNGFVLYLSLPAVTFLQFHEMMLHSSPTSGSGTFLAAWAAWVLLFFSLIFLWPLGRILNLERKTLGALVLTTGFANTSFVGYPMLDAIYGPDSLKTGIIVDQLGSFPALTTLGLLIASVFSARVLSFREMLKQILSFPPFYALVLAIVFHAWEYPSIIKELLTRLSSTLTPVALVSVGYQLKLNWKQLRKDSGLLFLGLFFKLALGPLLVAGFYRWILQANGMPVQIAIVETAMAPMITAAIVVSQYKLNSEFANLMIGIGIPLSFLTVPLWASILPQFF